MLDVRRHSPVTGPRSGGTVVTVEGFNLLQLNLPHIYIGNTRCADTQRYASLLSVMRTRNNSKRITHNKIKVRDPDIYYIYWYFPQSSSNGLVINSPPQSGNTWGHNKWFSPNRHYDSWARALGIQWHASPCVSLIRSGYLLQGGRHQGEVHDGSHRLGPHRPTSVGEGSMDQRSLPHTCRDPVLYLQTKPHSPWDHTTENNCRVSVLKYQF